MVWGLDLRVQDMKTVFEGVRVNSCRKVRFWCRVTFGIMMQGSNFRVDGSGVGLEDVGCAL